MIEKLDNPVWHSLLETHKQFSISYANLKCYIPDCCSFGSFEKKFEPKDDISNQIDEYANLTDNFFIVGERPGFSGGIGLKNELVCAQMIIEHIISFEPEEHIVRLNSKYDQSLFDLVNLVQPGYFKEKTVLMGDYYGIFKDDQLIAVTGERMKMNDFTEVSAVVTHPHYTGRGFAKQLVSHTVNRILSQNKIPYLHVAEKNIVAIKLYETLGFKTRRKISFWNLIKL